MWRRLRRIRLSRRCSSFTVRCSASSCPGLTRWCEPNAPQRLPVVLARGEVQRVLERMDAVCRLLARLLYGTGMRLMDGIRLRVQDVDFAPAEIRIRDGKGARDRVTMLPEGASADLCEHLGRRKLVFEDDLRAGKASVFLPDTLERKYPAPRTSWSWRYVFVAGSYSVDPRRGVERLSGFIIWTRSCCSAR